MTVSIAQPLHPDSAAARAEDLGELLAYVTACGDEEKRQLARRLHDNLGSSLTALTMHLSLLAQQMPSDRQLQERSAQIRRILSGVIDNNRALQAQLWNDKLQFLGLKAALADAVEQFGNETALAVQLQLADSHADYPAGHNLAILRLVEEGLRNVRQHAQAQQVEVLVEDDGSRLTASVCDDGVGPPGQLPFGCHGLRLLRERARSLGGSVALVAKRERGACLSMTLPWQANAT